MNSCAILGNNCTPYILVKVLVQAQKYLLYCGVCLCMHCYRSACAFLAAGVAQLYCQYYHLSASTLDWGPYATLRFRFCAGFVPHHFKRCRNHPFYRASFNTVCAMQQSSQPERASHFFLVYVRS